MTKSERIFEMLRYIREDPNLTPDDLSRLCKVSERGIYRYLNTLSRAGILVRFRKGGYKILEDASDLLKIFDIRGLQAIKALVVIGMQNCDDDKLLRHGRDFVALLGENLPGPKGRLDEIQIAAAENGLEKENVS